MNWKNILKKLRNPGTVVGLVGMTGLLLTQFGVQIDLEWLDTTVKIICAICVTLGVMNNSETPGVDLPGIKSK